MRCPKCGYNSFDHLDNCKKCGKDLSDHKSRFGIRSVMLPSIVAEEEEPAVTEDETAEAVDTQEVEEPVAAETTGESSDQQADGFEFDFISGEEEKENLAFDELFEEPPPEDDLDETLPSPEKEAESADEEEELETTAEEFDEEVLDDPDTFNLEDPESEPDELLTETDEDLTTEDFAEDEEEPADKEVLTLDQPDLGLDEAEEMEETVSEATELGLDESDFDEFKKQGIEGSTEGPDHPFGGKENLQREGSSIIEKAVSAAQADDEPADFLTDQEEQPEEGADTQPGLFGSDEKLPPLPDTRIDEQPLESLEATYGNGPYDSTAAGESDDFSLGTLPGSGLADIPQVQAVEEGADQAEAGEKTEPAPEDGEAGELTPGVTPPFARRISAFLCDVILIGLVGLCFIVVAETALSEKPTGMFPTMETLIDLSIPYFLVVFCLTFGYFTLFHFLTGQTPGKMVMGMRVETFSGEALAFSQAFMRSVGGLIQILPAGLGYLTILNAEGRGWNDRLAGTRLVDLKSSEETQEDEAGESDPEDSEETES